MRLGPHALTGSPGSDIYEIGENYILGRVTDELGVEYVQVWPLRR